MANFPPIIIITGIKRISIESFRLLFTTVIYCNYHFLMWNNNQTAACHVRASKFMAALSSVKKASSPYLCAINKLKSRRVFDLAKYNNNKTEILGGSIVTCVTWLD